MAIIIVINKDKLVKNHFFITFESSFRHVFSRNPVFSTRYGNVFFTFLRDHQ
jgi:hypothetical protein